MRELEWDTGFFGIRLARADRLADDVVAEARRRGVECLVLDLPSGAPVDVPGARLVDDRVELERMGDPPLVDPRARVAVPEDEDALDPLAASLAGWSRFSRDDRFDPERVREMYRIWLGRCLREGVVASAVEGSGFVGVLPRGAVAHVDLVYVAPEDAGRGLAGALLATALATAALPTARVATQADNEAALALYRRLGFVPVARAAVYHLWLDEVA